MSRLKITGFLISLTLLAVIAWAGQDFMSVQVKKGQLRATPSFLGKIVANLAYGDRVEVLREQGKWIEVRHGRKSGWLHESALTADRIVLSSGRGDVPTGASSEELALAGKGFNAQVEEEFKTQNKDIDFSWVNRMEKIVISPREMITFLKNGDIQPRPGGGE